MTLKLVDIPVEGGPPEMCPFDEPKLDNTSPQESANPPTGSGLSPTLSALSAAEALGANGPLASMIEGYEVRPGQIAMTTAVERMCRGGGVLAVEAGTGVGKSFGYLVAAIMAAPKPVIVSTGTIPLQEQLVAKDLPTLERAGLEPRAVHLLGKANYLCPIRLKTALEEIEVDDAHRFEITLGISFGAETFK